MKKIVLLLLFTYTSLSLAQITFRITAIPVNTPPNSTIYLAGSVNTWNPSSSQYILQPDGLGAYLLTIPEGTGTIEYKFTRGSWPTVEGNANGGYLPNRTINFTGNPQIVNLTIQSWEDIAGSGSSSTAASNVQILSNSFFIPQLNRNRKIWLYLPPDYFTTTKTYPVLYMHDGQNLFDNATSFSGEWQIDETLNNLHAQGNYGAIVVGIENGGSNRLNEYSPWVNTQYGGGQGDLYNDFITETLKPYIDLNFRTKPQPQFNALIGSSMGALISTYGGIESVTSFNKIGVFSPAFWFAQSDLINYINASTSDLSNLRLYFVAGQNESTTMVTHINQVNNALISKGVQNTNSLTKFDSYGTHTEAYWRGEFAAAYQWLFQQETLTTDEFEVEKLKLYYNQNVVYAIGFKQTQKFDLYSIIGNKIGEINIQNGSNELNFILEKGIYFLVNSNSKFKIIIN
jgi:alpha-glucosidase